jgi:hypothetical protein
MRHGTFENYLRTGCVCELCFKAAKEVHRKRKSLTVSKPGPAKPDGPKFAHWKHGVRSTYVAGCRCEPCREAAKLHQRNRRATFPLV